jgi:hypothetical protein
MFEYVQTTDSILDALGQINLKEVKRIEAPDIYKVPDWAPQSRPFVAKDIHAPLLTSVKFSACRRFLSVHRILNLLEHIRAPCLKEVIALEEPMREILLSLSKTDAPAPTTGHLDVLYLQLHLRNSPLDELWDDNSPQPWGFLEYSLLSGLLKLHLDLVVSEWCHDSIDDILPFFGLLSSNTSSSEGRLTPAHLTSLESFEINARISRTKFKKLPDALQTQIQAIRECRPTCQVTLTFTDPA